jgi:CheY-like chemotaxis protein
MATIRPLAVTDFSNPFQAFQNLMPYRVQDILLVSTLYDSFTLQEDGRLNELIVGEFLELSLHQTPGVTHVSNAREALEMAKAENRFNLIITAPNPGDLDAVGLAREVRRAGLDVPVVVLAFDNHEAKAFMASNDLSEVERVFLWQGNARILVAIVKLVEDARNAVHDTATMGVPVILVVEDNVRYYSSFLPVIYTELIKQSERLVSEGVNLSHKLVRMRARPKILHARTFEEAWDLFEVHRDSLLGLISDVEFPAGGESTPEAGFALARRVRMAAPDLPILLQSSRPQFAIGAAEMGASFLRKYSDTLLTDLRKFMNEHFAFGDFVFRLPDGTEVDRASDLKTLEEKLRTVPAESIGFHGERNHFSNWFTARTEFALARKLRPRRVDDFPTLEGLRDDLVRSIADYRREQAETLVADFDRHTFDPGASFFARVGGGSLGGKARGLAFVRYLLNYHAIGRRFPGVKVSVPSAVVLATDCFDRFLQANELLAPALAGTFDDDELERRFLAAPLPGDVVQDLAAFLEGVRWPLAVRSSSLLEDSQYLPFTGVYETFMLPNNHPALAERLRQLCDAIRRVYASTFTAQARAYLHATPFRLEEEKMAVMVQRVVGAPHGQRYYPDFSGVARSYNFYPAPPLTSEDGVASVALGLGRTVVEGGRFLSFCPRDAAHILHFSSVDDILRNSQRDFWALEMEHGDDGDAGQAMRETSFGLDVAERDGTLLALGSTWSPENQAIYDGLSRPGARLVTFAPVLKHGVFPLAGLLTTLLDIGTRGMNREAEIEFAVRLSRDASAPHEFGFLQMRPLVLSQMTEAVEIGAVKRADLIASSPRVLGNGRVDDLHDIVAVDFHRFERAHSRAAAEAVARFNARLVAARRPYLLIGVGRWGSTDPWLGLPVAWEQIAGARVIVEAGFRDMRVTPSQGSHFFQNLTSFQVGYFTVNAELDEGFVDWDWLAAQPAVAGDGAVRHLVLDAPVLVKMDGRSGAGVIYKPGASED